MPRTPRLHARANAWACRLEARRDAAYARLAEAELRNDDANAELAQLDYLVWANALRAVLPHAHPRRPEEVAAL